MSRESMIHWDAARTFTAAAVLFSAFALGVTGVSVGHNLSQRLAQQREDLAKAVPNSDRDLFTPVEERIKEQESYLKKIKDPALVAEEQRKLAQLYVMLGNRSESLGRFAQAEMALQRAMALEPQNAERPARLAQLYYVAASSKPDADWQLELYRSSANFYSKAMESTVEPATRQAYRGYLADSYSRMAQTYERMGRSDWAAEAQRKAENPGS